MSDTTELLTQAEVTKLTLAVARGLPAPFMEEQLVAEADKICAWARGVRIDGALLAGVLGGELGVRFDGMTEPEPEAKFFRLARVKVETCAHGGVVSENAGAKMCAATQETLVSEAEKLLEELLDTEDGAVSETRLERALLERHPDEPVAQLVVAAAVKSVFAARRSAELSGTPAEHLEHAAELERYLDDREKKNTAGGDRTEGDAR